MVGLSVAALPNSLHGSQAGTTGTEKSPGTFSGMPADLHRMRVIFPDRWSAFLRNHFRNARHVQFFFDVDDRTARNWWHGVTGPSAFAVVAAASVNPAVIPWMMGEAA